MYLKIILSLDLNDGQPPIGGGPSTSMEGESRGSIIYLDDAGYEYHTNWVLRDTR